MKIEDVKEGLYVLTRDVENPYPDRRKVYDWRGAAVWTKGTIFTARRNYSPLADGSTFVSVHTGRWSSHDLAVRTLPRPSEKREFTKLAALTDALEPFKPQTAEQALREVDLQDWLAEAIDRLVAEGRITFDDVVNAARAASETPEEERP